MLFLRSHHVNMGPLSPSPQLKHRVKRNYPSTASGDSGTAGVDLVHLKIGCEVATTL